MPTIEELLAKLIGLSGPCPEICDETIPLGGSGGTQTVDIKTGVPVSEYPPPDNGETPAFRECCMSMSGSPFASGSTLDPLYYEYVNTAEISTNEYNFDFTCTDSSVTLEVTITSNIAWPPLSGAPIMKVWIDSTSYTMIEGVTQTITITTGGVFYVTIGNNPFDDIDLDILVENITCGASQIINLVNLFQP
jgi:hypothetical protein